MPVKRVQNPGEQRSGTPAALPYPVTISGDLQDIRPILYRGEVPPTRQERRFSRVGRQQDADPPSTA